MAARENELVTLNPDREKVIKGLECHVKGDCAECPYREGWHTCNPTPESGLFADAIVLLKAQEPIKLREEETKLSKMYGENIFRNYYCGQCNHPLDHIIWRDKYCPECGRKVLWND